MRMVIEARIPKEECMELRYKKLALIEEKRMKVMYHNKVYYKRMARPSTRKYGPRSYKGGVLC